jgi:hypothetical protein
MSTITNKESLRNIHYNLTKKINGWDMSFEDFAKSMEDASVRHNVNNSLKVYFPGYSATDEEFDSSLGVIKSDLPSPTDEIQQMSRPENNTAIINDLSKNLLKESNEIKKETEDPNIFETIGKGLASGIVRVGSGLMHQFSKVDPAILSSVTGGPNYVALYDPNRKTGKEQEKAAIEAATELRHISERLADEATPSNAKEKGFLGSLAEGNIGDAFQYALATTAQSIPQMIGYMNPYTIAPLAYAEFGAKMNELEERNPDMKEGKKIASAFGSTLLEVAIERFTGDFGKMFKGKVKPEQSKQITKELARQLESNVYRRILGYSLDFTKGFGKSAAGEGFEEGLTYALDKGYNTLLDLDGSDGIGLKRQYEKFKELNPDADAGDFAKIITSELLESVAQGAMGGAYMHAGTSATAGVVNSFNKNRQIDNKVTVEAIKRVASEEGLKRLDVINKWGDVLSKKLSGEELSEEEIDFYNKIVNKKSHVAKLYGNINQSETPKYNWSKDQLTEEQKKEYNRTIAEASKEKVEIPLVEEVDAVEGPPIEIVLEEQEKQADTPSPVVSPTSTPTSSGAVSTPEIDTEAEVAKANATFGKASNKDGNLYEVSAFVNGKNVEGALRGEVVLTEDGKLDIEKSKGLIFIPKGNGKYTSKAIPLTDAEYNSVTINNVFNKEQYAEQAVNNAKQAAQSVSLNELIRQTLQAQTTPEAAENGVAETSSNTDVGVTDNAVENQVSYPTKKDGSIDYDNLTPEQEYSLTAQEYGEDVAQEDVKSYIEQYQSAIDNIQSQLDSKNGTNSRAKMREAMRKNQEKLEAWKALLKEETIAEENAGEDLVEEEKSSIFENNNKQDGKGNRKNDNPVVQQQNGGVSSTIQGEIRGTSSNENEGLGNGTRSRNAENGRNGGTDNGISNESNSQLPIDKEVGTNATNNGGKVSELSDKIEKELTERGISHTSQNIRLASSQEFHDAIAAEKQNNPNGWMVDVHSVEDYEHDICMLTEDGKAGIAVTPDGDIISVFSSVKGDHRLEKLMMMAIQMGGRKLDCYYMLENNNITGLPRLYAKFGFEVAATTPFAEEYAPEGYFEWAKNNENKIAGVAAMYIPEDVAINTVESYSNTKLPNSNAPVFDGENGYDSMLSHRDEKMKEPKSPQTPEEVVQEAILETVQSRYDRELSKLTNDGTATEEILTALEERKSAENKFYTMLKSIGVTLKGKTPSPTGKFMGAVLRSVENLQEDVRDAVLAATAGYKKAAVHYHNTYLLESKLSKIEDQKVFSETKEASNVAIKDVKAVNDALIDMMIETGDFSFEELVITSSSDRDTGEEDAMGMTHKDRLGKALSNNDKKLSDKRINAFNSFEDILKKARGRAKAKREKQMPEGLSESDVVKLTIRKRGKAKDVYVTKKDYEYISTEKDFQERIDTYRKNGEVYQKIPNGRVYLSEIIDENGEQQFKQEIKEKVVGNLQVLKTDRSPKAIIEGIITYLQNIKSVKGVDTVKEFKAQIQTLRDRVVSLAKAISKSDIDETVKESLLNKIDVAYFSELENIKENNEKGLETPTPSEGSVASAISKIRTQAKEIKYTRSVKNKKAQKTTTRNDTRLENVSELVSTKGNQEALKSLITTFEKMLNELQVEISNEEQVEIFNEKQMDEQVLLEEKDKAWKEEGKEFEEKETEDEKDKKARKKAKSKKVSREIEFLENDDFKDIDDFSGQEFMPDLSYSKGETSNMSASLKETLKDVSNLVRGFNLQGRVVVATNLDQLKKINKKAYEAEISGEKVKGFYSPSKHQIVLYVPNLLSKGSVENVILHEGIAHFGLRELLGEEEFNNFCKQVWKAMSHADKKEMMKYIGKKYVYNQKVSEEDMIAAAEEYVAHLAETPMFAEYLRNRNEQEAVSWINKKWKKVCDLIRKIFKKRTGEELLSSDENIMDALYRSYQLLGSNDYAMFDYYRSLTEQMRKEDVKVGEINEEEIEEAYVNKATLGERSGVISGNSSSEGLLASPNGPLSLVSFGNKQDATKVKSFEDISKATREIMPRIKKVINRGGLEDVRTEVDAVRAVGRALKLYPSHSSKSYYGDFFEGDYIVNGKVVHLRISTHPATPVRMGNAEADHKVSIVIRKNGEHKSDGTPHGGYTEYVYEPSEVTPQDAANAVVKGVKSLLETGEFVDETGKAVRRDYPYTDNRGRIMYSRITPEMDASYLDAVENGDITPQDSESGVRFSKVTDPFKIAELEAGEKMKTYRAMALIDGKLYPPMSSKNDGVLREPSEIGVWEEAEENPDKAKEKNGKYYFTLIKDNGKNVRDVAYNPYLHSSTTMLNDQFKEAQSRDNLVVVEMEIPTSELTSGYKADKAHDAVGTKDWKAGTIQGQLTGTREVVLSRWGKPVRIVPVEEVADNIKGLIDGQVEYMPTNVVTPQQRKALEDLGVKFVETNNNEIIQEGEHKGERYSAIYGKKAKNKNAEQGTILFSKGKPAGYVNLSNKFKPQKQPMSALVAREQAVANAVMEWFREMVGAENIVTDVRAMTDVYINALNNGERIRVLHTSKKGEDVILGFEHNGVHYLDMGAMDSGLLLYELGTVWVDILKKNDALWERAKEVCRSTKEYKSLVNTAAYKRGEVTEEDVVKEVLAYHISELGTRLGNNLNVSNDIKEEFEYKVGFAFAELKNTLSRFDEYELSKLGVEDFARLSLRDIVLNTSMADSEAVVSDLEDSSEDETPTDKRVKHGTYLRYAPRKKETTGEYLERLQKDRYWNEASLYGQADVDIAIAVLQSAVEKEMGGQIPEALDVYNMIDSFDSAAYNKINSFENNVAKPYKKLLRKLGKQLKKHPDIKSLKISRLDSIYWYMQAKDIVERQQIDGIDRGRKGLEDALGMSLERYIGLVEGFLGNESINQLWDETNSITDNILMMYKQLGEINDTDIASMKRRFYVPEIGFVDDKNKDGVSGRFAGRQVAPLSTDNKHQIKKSKGRGNSIADSPFYNMIDGSISLIYEIEKRKVQDALIGLAEYAMLNGVDISKFFVLNNEGGLLHDKSKGGSIKVGSPKDASYVYFNEQNNLGKTLQNAFSTSSKKGKYDGVVLWWKNFMSNSYTTWKLAFVFKNLPKDIKATLATATIKYGIGVPAKVSKNLWLKGLWWSVLKYNFNGSTKSKYGDLIKQYYESGAGTGYAELRHEKKLRQLESSAFERKYFNPFTYIELLADLSEGMPRIALYKAMLDSGYTEHSAKIAARNATINFGRQAGGVVADIATTAIPFYRASTSGGEGWLRTLTTRGEEKTSITNHLLRASLTLTSFFAVGVLMALADDEDDDDTDYDEWTDYLLRVNDSPYLGQDRMYVGGVVPSYFAQNHTPFVQAGYDFVRMLQDEKSGYDISVDFITNLLTSTIAANELQQLPVSLTRSIITDESLGDAITKQAIKMSDINPISKIARAWVGIDDFGNKRYENKNKSGYGNASGDAAYIYRKIADYAASTSDMQHPEKAKEQYIGDNGEIQERKLNWVQDINSDKLEDVTNALLPFMEGFISSVSNAAEQLIEREEFDWLEFTKETPVINKVFYNTPKTNLEKLESGYKLMNRYINSYIQGEGDFGSKELKENNKYLRMNAFDDTTDYKERLEEYEYYIKNYKGNEDIVKKIVERDIKTWKRRRKEMFGN